MNISNNPQISRQITTADFEAMVDIMYKGWNFKSANYLFTTDTK